MDVADQIASGRHATLPAGSVVRELTPLDLDPTSIGGLAVRSTWGDATVAELLARHDCRGMVVIHRGNLAFEHHGPRCGPDTANLCYSITKSFTGLLAAESVRSGRLDRNGPVAAVLPELATSGFADATVAEVADMTAAIAYDEDYDENEASALGAGRRTFGDYVAALGLDDATHVDGQPASIRTLLPTIGRGVRPHGEAFGYATPLTDVLAWLVERVDGRDGADALDASFWSCIGAEHDAALTRDRAGTALMAAGLSMTTRDLARFGAMLGAGGCHDGVQVVDRSLIETIRDGGDPDVFARNGHHAYLTGYSYRDQWWLPGGTSRPLSAWGIHGQVLWIDPDAEVVVAYHCGGPRPSDHQRDLEQDALCRALVEASSHWD